MLCKLFFLAGAWHACGYTSPATVFQKEPGDVLPSAMVRREFGEALMQREPGRYAWAREQEATLGQQSPSGAPVDGATSPSKANETSPVGESNPHPQTQAPISVAPEKGRHGKKRRNR